MARPETLSEFVTRIVAEKQLNPVDVERRSRGLISFGYVADLMNGRAGNPSVKKLQALAKGLGVSEDTVFDVARGKRPSELSEPMASIIAKYEQLSPEQVQQARAVLELLDREMDRLLSLGAAAEESVRRKRKAS